MARRLVIRRWLCEIVDGTLDPYTGVGLVMAYGWHAMSQPAVLHEMVALMDYWDEMPEQRDKLLLDLAEAARTVLDAW
ncbi:hypothetical protein [Pseudarthrobacter sp. N5]|uniref:hypothetical protein n=1 Tax=Pseudarthrobacter sp. N5 TaxID=3418416 RepID=UPI003CEE9D2C